MFYARTKINSEVEIKIDLYEDEIFTQCPNCGQEIQLPPKELAEIIKEHGITGTSVYCEKCSKKMQSNTQIWIRKDNRKCQKKLKH